MSKNIFKKYISKYLDRLIKTFYNQEEYELTNILYNSLKLERISGLKNITQSNNNLIFETENLNFRFKVNINEANFDKYCLTFYVGNVKNKFEFSSEISLLYFFKSLRCIYENPLLEKLIKHLGYNNIDLRLLIKLNENRITLSIDNIRDNIYDFGYLNIEFTTILNSSYDINHQVIKIKNKSNNKWDFIHTSFSKSNYNFDEKYLNKTFSELKEMILKIGVGNVY